MPVKVLLEFFPEIILEIPESPGGSCCLKPIATQSKTSKKMYLIAQHIQWTYKNRINLVIPPKTESRILLIKKYTRFKSDRRKKRLGISKLPGLALDSKVLCDGVIPDEKVLEKKVKEIMDS